MSVGNDGGSAEATDQFHLALARARTARKQRDQEKLDRQVLLAATLTLGCDLARGLNYQNLAARLREEALVLLDRVEAERVVTAELDDREAAEARAVSSGDGRS